MQTTTQQQLLPAAWGQCREQNYFITCLSKPGAKTKRLRHRDTDLSRSLNSRKASRLQRAKAGHANCFTFIIIQGKKSRMKAAKKIAVHSSRVVKVKLSKRQCILMNISHNSWKIRFSTSLNPTNILNCSKKINEPIRTVEISYFVLEELLLECRSPKKVLG